MNEINNSSFSEKVKLAGLSAALATFVIILLSFGKGFTFSTDDYAWLHLIEKGGIPWPVFREHWARVPMQNIAVWVMYTTGFINDSSSTFYYIGFFFHSFSLVLLCQFLWKAWQQSTLKSEQIENLKILSWPVIITMALICLYPNNFEVTFWATTFPYIWGAIFIALGFCQNSLWLRFFLIILAYMTTESFILATLFFSISKAFFKNNEGAKPLLKNKDFHKNLIFWASSVLFFIIYRKVAAQYFGEPVNKAVLSPLNIFSRIPLLIKQTFFLHFYKTSFANSAGFIIAQFLILFFIIKDKFIPLKILAKAIISIFLSCSIYLLVGYIAPRILYGGHLFYMALFGCLILTFFQVNKDKQAKVIVSLTALSFLMHHFYIFKTKDYNAKLLNKRIEKLKADMANCQEPCTIKTGEINHGLKRDWVLHKDYYPYFLGHLKEKFYPNKKIRFIHPK